jgi:DnaK suppressor protein
MADYESNLTLDEQLEYLLAKIKKALKAIDEGTYGQCLACRKNIENGRLEIMPYADLCVTCKGEKKK